MPHQCTACGHAFADGSKEMLGGCPDCGGNKFQFYPEGTGVPDEPPSEAEAAAPEAPEPSVSSTVGRATTKVRDFVSSGPPDGSDPGPDAGDEPAPDAAWPTETDPSVSGGDADIIDADARETERALTDAEDHAQASARSELASEAEVEASSPDGTATPPGDDAPAADAASASSDGTAQPRDGTAPPRDGTAPPPDGSPVDRSSAPDGASAQDGTSAPDDAGTTAPADHEPGSGDARPVDDSAGRVVSQPTDRETDVSELREQLNDQFESIKILEPGQYELNLMELYDREEYIIALQENGRYMIQVPEQWHGSDIDG
jgi:predicted  nucleic acid-binding Zn-ribbon protein